MVDKIHIAVDHVKRFFKDIDIVGRNFLRPGGHLPIYIRRGHGDISTFVHAGAQWTHAQVGITIWRQVEYILLTSCGRPQDPQGVDFSSGIGLEFRWIARSGYHPGIGQRLPAELEGPTLADYAAGLQLGVIVGNATCLDSPVR